mmetsp:Transcript_38867/g.46822  ORF Transcript_38867/g.46822 Transcript_38867/m.46822 type:complete len:222 (+) Transcript_38867:194-859(+)
MNQMKQKSTAAIILKCFLPPSPKPWDDFLDFSRMRLPLLTKFRIISKCRIKGNYSKAGFVGNYIWLLVWSLLLAGVISDMNIFFASLISSMVWVILCITSLIEDDHRNRILSIPNRNTTGIIVSSIVFSRYSSLWRVLVILVLVLKVTFVHAISFPVLHEKRAEEKVSIATDGYIDKIRKGDKAFETIDTTKNCLRHRSLSPSTKLDLPLGGSKKHPAKLS